MNKEAGLVMVPRNLEELMGELEQEPTIINDLSLDTEEDQRFLEGLTVTTCDSTDVIATRPSCQCGKYQSGHNVGYRCEKCGYTVTSPVLRKIEANLWVAAPREIEFFFSPLAWIMLSKPITSRKFNGLEWMCNPLRPTPEVTTRPNCKVSRIINHFHKLGIPRGLRSVLANFDLIFEKIILKNTTSLVKRQDLTAFIERYRSAIFTRVLPIPSKVAMVVEETSVGTYYDQTMDSAVEAAFTAAGTSGETNVVRLEQRFTTVMANLGTYYQDVVSNVLSSKKGWLRRVLYGNRLNMSYRNIITSRHEPHEYDTLLVPYHQLLSVLQFVVIGILIREHDLTHSQAYSYVNEHAKDKDPLLWSILERLIDETPPLHPSKVSPVEKELPSTLTTRERKGRGIISTLTRFPSLDRGSTQWFRIVGLTEHDIKISVLAVRGPNADESFQLRNS